jgi:signal transduction histidine kinase
MLRGGVAEIAFPAIAGEIARELDAGSYLVVIERDGQRDVRLSLRVRRDEGCRVVIEIRDTGPGIPLEDQAKVFDRFYRVDKARWRESGGAGLGLSIAKWAVESHGGAVMLESEPDRGCVFRITLPSADAPPKSTPPASPVPASEHA